MAFSRRSVLVQGGVIGAGLIASDVPGFRALVWATGEPTRKSLAGLAWNDPIVSAYRDAVGIMKATTSLDVLSWDQLGRTHKGYCPHGNWYFLPWHRAFVVSIERIVRALTSTADFAMPYWDWTANPEFPEVFRPEKTPDNKPNHLYVSTRTWDIIISVQIVETIVRHGHFSRRNGAEARFVSAAAYICLIGRNGADICSVLINTKNVPGEGQ